MAIQTFVAAFYFIAATSVVYAHEDRETALDFETDIRPIFERHCVKCHGQKKRRGGFGLEDSQSPFAEADSGELPIVPNESESSELLRRILSTDEGEWMPPEGPRLAAEETDMLRRWIDSGASWPRSSHPKSAPPGELVVTDDDRRFWSFRDLEFVEVPKIEDDWVRNPIDAFILRAMKKRGLEFSDRASALVLRRRMHFDAIGLPPSFDQPIEFDQSASADALADKLLASEHFGERWARHWLDVARYADSNGYENDLDRPYAYQYRDFVIRAFNEDLPFDQFVRWQVAGDEIAPSEPMAIAATGFLAAGPTNRTAPTVPDEILKKMRFDELDDIVATTSQAILGLTLGCARCHDHKFDPIPTRDYYRLVAAFASTRRHESSLDLATRKLDLWTKDSKAEFLRAKVDSLGCTEDERKWLLEGPRNPAESKSAFKKYGKKIAFTDEQWRRSLSENDRATLASLELATDQSVGEWKDKTALLIVDRKGEPVQVHLLNRGDVGLPGDRVTPGFLSVMTKDRQFEDYHDSINAEHSNGYRLAVANWLLDVEDGAGALAARVIVNRVWQHYFGQGLVTTPNDFGLQGQRPSHPALLDWLAGELIRNDWKLKSIHRLILRSNTYRQSSRIDPQRNQLDPDNRWLSRQNAKRLDSEATRDAILFSSGRLQRRLFGPGVRPFVPVAAMSTRSKDKWPTDVTEGPDHWRRSIYIFVKRSIRFPMMEAFDSPDPTASCGQRIPTTVPVQALTLMNNPSVRGAACDCAEAIRRGGNDLDEHVKTAFTRFLARPPTVIELDTSKQFLSSADTGGNEDRLADLCHALLMSNEFVYIE